MDSTVLTISVAPDTRDFRPDPARRFRRQNIANAAVSKA